MSSLCSQQQSERWRDGIRPGSVQPQPSGDTVVPPWKGCRDTEGLTPLFGCGEPFPTITTEKKRVSTYVDVVGAQGEKRSTATPNPLGLLRFAAMCVEMSSRDQ